MEPSIIVTALITAIANLAEPAVKDAYNGLKTLILNKYKENAEVQGSLAGVEKKPEIWRQPLEESLQEVNVDSDTEITAAVENLNRILKEKKAANPQGIHVNWTSGAISGEPIIVAGTSDSQISIRAEKKDDRKE